MTDTNIKNLPEGDYFTELAYSQSYPHVVVGRTAKTIKVAAVEVKPDPDWKPEIVPGGFIGHCTNQYGQTWLFDRIRSDYITILRKNKHGDWVNRGRKFIEGRATEFYDYNF